MTKFEIYQGEDKGEQRWRWRLITEKGDNIGKSEEPFIKGSIKGSIKKIQGKVKSALIFEDESEEDIKKDFHFECFQSSKNQKWYWRLKAANNEPMAIGGEGFKSKEQVLSEINNFKNLAVCAEIKWENEQDDPAYQEKCDDRTEPKGEGTKLINVIVNATQHKWDKQEICYDDVINLAVSCHSPELNIIYSVKYSKGCTSKPEGILSPKACINVKEGIVFHVSETIQS